jgi:uncharacterized membrane protein
MRWNLAAAASIVLGLACGPSDLGTVALRAFGNEPFWNVTVSATAGIVYERLGEEGIIFPYQAPRHPADDGTTLLFGPLRTGSGEHEIEMRVSEEDCQDTMADAVHPMRAIVNLDGEELTGCARRLDDDPGAESP